MTQAISRRGPDDEGAWVAAENGIALGHRRLSIVDLSPAGHQPMASASGRYHIVFNGEVYNFGALREELRGATFRGGSDTEVMLAAIERWGLEGAVSRFIGMFAFALWDAQERRFHLVRDRLGIKPLFYAQTESTLLFGSELKALLVHPELERDLNLPAVASYFRFGYVPAPHAILHGVRKLLPGTILSFGEPGLKPSEVRYWCPETFAAAAPSFAGTDADAVDALDALLRDSIRLRMIADVPLGAFLSGGIDSSTVVALMQAQSTRPIKTFSIGNESGKFDESGAAAAVAKHLGTEHTAFTASGEVALAVVPELPSIFDEPFADSSQIPTLLVSQLARRHVTVALSGDGGDELFGGYNRHVYAPPLHNSFGSLPGSWRARAARLLREAGNILERRETTLLDQWVRLPGQKLPKVAALLEAEDATAMYRTLCSQWQAPQDLLPGVPREAAEGFPLPSRDLAAALMLADQRTYLPDDILTKVDRASMHHALEARVPILDHRVVEFSWTLPTRLKVRRLRGKLPLRGVLHRYVPRELVDRPKMGFGIPLASWLRGPLRGWTEELLAPARLRDAGIYATETVRDAWAQHADETTDHSAKLWTLLMFEAWRAWLPTVPVCP